jgi:hypothetical protein
LNVPAIKPDYEKRIAARFGQECAEMVSAYLKTGNQSLAACLLNRRSIEIPLSLVLYKNQRRYERVAVRKTPLWNQMVVRHRLMIVVAVCLEDENLKDIGELLLYLNKNQGFVSYRGYTGSSGMPLSERLPKKSVEMFKIYFGETGPSDNLPVVHQTAGNTVRIKDSYPDEEYSL